MSGVDLDAVCYGDVDKRRISRSFTRHAQTYERFAVQQRVGIEALIKEIDCCLDGLVEGPVLEVGCGTGLLSGPLIKRLEGRAVLLSDLTAAMLEVCRMNVGTVAGPKVCWQVLDGEAIQDQAAYALIASAFAVHWFKDPVAGLDRLIGALRPGGWLFCVYQGDGSYPQWRQVCQQTGIPYTANDLPQLEQMEAAVARWGTRVEGQCWSRAVSCAYRSPGDFFKHVQRTGAAVRPATATALGTAQLRRLLAAWGASETGIEVTHQLHFIKVQRVG